jgi:RNA polymerase sigma-70 factor (ECF subfamily)
VTGAEDWSDARLVEGLRARDERAFEWLIDRYRPALVRLARQYVSTPSAAEEVVQDTFVAVFTGVHRFEGRSSFKTWLYRILLNIARTRGVRDRRSVPFASIGPTDLQGDSIEADWFVGVDEDRDRHWRSSPRRWEGFPEDRVLAGELRDVLEVALVSLPAAQREVVVMRDVMGMSSDEVRNALEISETNQRVLLHRGRTRLRAALDDYYAGSDAEPSSNESLGQSAGHEPADHSECQ